MPTIAEIRTKYPQYDDMSDDDLATALHSKFYADMPETEFRSKIGMEAKPVPVGRHLSFEEGQALLDKEAQDERMKGASGTVGAALTSAVDGLPVVGPVLLGGAQRGAAALSSAIDGGDYDEKVKEAQRLTATAQNEHPIVSTAGSVAGAVGGTIPMIAAAPAAFGAGAGNLAARTVASLVTGTGLGTADSAVRSGGDLEAMKVGAQLGAVSGLVGPIAGKVIGKGVGKAIDKFKDWRAAGTGEDLDALKYLRRALQADGLDETAVQQRLGEMGPEAMLADLGPNLQRQAGALAATPGRSQEIVRSGLTARQAGANARLAQAADESLGEAIPPSTVKATIKANQMALRPEYQEVFKNARAVDTRPIADALESQMVNLRGDAQKAARDVRRMLDITGTDQLDPNPSTLFQTREAIDGLFKAKKDSKVIATLAEARKSIDDLLAANVPGIKEVDAKFAELARQKDALKRGQSVLDSGRTAPWPSELAQEVVDGAIPQGLLVGPSAVPLRLSQGARADIQRILGNKSNDIVALNQLIKGEGDWNRQKLATLFGAEKADRLFKVLENERIYANTSRIVTENSETAARQAAQRELGVTAEGGFGAKEAFKAGGVRGAIRSKAIDTADDMFGSLMGKRGEATRESLAKNLVGSERDRVIEALMRLGTPGASDPRMERIARALMTGGSLSAARP